MCLKNWMYLTLQQQKQSTEGQKNQASYLALKQNKIVSSDGCFVLLQKSNVEKKNSLFTFSTAPPESLVSLRRFSWLDRSENNLKTSCQLNGFYTKHTLTQFLRNSVHSSVI